MAFNHGACWTMSRLAGGWNKGSDWVTVCMWTGVPEQMAGTGGNCMYSKALPYLAAPKRDDDDDDGETKLGGSEKA